MNQLVTDLDAILLRLIRADIHLAHAVATQPVLAYVDPTQNGSEGCASCTSEAAQLSGDAPFIQKPFTADGLVQKVREVLDH
jgi:hypothetical protein